MNLKVKHDFFDIREQRYRDEGEEFSADTDRGGHLVSLGLCEQTMQEEAVADPSVTAEPDHGTEAETEQTENSQNETA